MTVGELMILEFGSRTGSLIALSIFGLAFCALGWTMGRNFRKPMHSISIAIVVFIFPMVLIYKSSLGGFYEAELQDDRVYLHFLLSPFTRSLPLDGIREIDAIPAFKGRWRMEIRMLDGRQYESATWNRQAVRESALRMRERLLPASSPTSSK